VRKIEEANQEALRRMLAGEPTLVDWCRQCRPFPIWRIK
jgi:hypothetical protein